ncbi:MAG: aminotransferase class I/II-fold pyridoxal phosphate-dependent enzyme [Thermaerobacter sp.]|nr:aminotransferase class I/II-fold pyridoxal phosphate-dependent enzyme [Thermaerobacter sp.]
MNISNRAPLWEAIKEHHSRASYPFHVPGHKGGRGLPSEFRADWAPYDLTELPGLDNLLCPSGPILAAEALAAEWAGARATHFTTNGSSAALIAAVLACCARGSQVVLPQNAHLSLFHACVLGDLCPVFVPVSLDSRLGIPLGFTPAALRQVLSTTQASLVVVVHPTYHGVCGDVAALSVVCREFGVPLLVDEAHGTHLLLADKAPFSAVRQGADLVVQSVHKTGTALTGAAWLHSMAEQWAERSKEALRLVQSTSPSYPLLASLDLARANMQRKGPPLLTEAVRVAQLARQLLPCFTPPLPYRQDPLRLVIDCAKLGLSGYELERLLVRRGVWPEMVEPHVVTLVWGLYDGEEALMCLKEAVSHLPYTVSPVFSPPESLPLPLCPTVLRPAEAYWQEKVGIPLNEACGRIAGAPVTPYPPGIPVIWPGQMFTEECVEYIMSRRDTSPSKGESQAREVKVLVHDKGS